MQTDLLAEIEAFLPDRRITESTFGRLAVNDGKFVRRLRDADNMTLATLEKARAFIAAERERAQSASTAVNATPDQAVAA